MMPTLVKKPLPLNDLELFVMMANRILKNKKYVRFICQHATSIYEQKEMMNSIKKISKIKENLLPTAFERTDEECGDLE